MTSVNNLVAITKGKQAAEMVAESREQARTAAHDRARRAALVAAELKRAALTDQLATSDQSVERTPSVAAALILPAAGFTAWAAYRSLAGEGDTLTAVALALSLAVPVAVASRWLPAPYPKLRFPAALMLPTAVAVLGAVSIATLISPILVAPWLVGVVALSGVLLQRSLSSWLLRRVQLKRAALDAEIDVRRADLGIEAREQVTRAPVVPVASRTNGKKTGGAR